MWQLHEGHAMKDMPSKLSAARLGSHDLHACASCRLSAHPRNLS